MCVRACVCVRACARAPSEDPHVSPVSLQDPTRLGFLAVLPTPNSPPLVCARMCARLEPRHRPCPSASPSRAPASHVPSSHPSPQGHYGDKRERFVFNSRAAIQGEGKIKRPKATRKQFTTGLYYCKRSLYTGTISSKTLTKWPSSQRPPPLGPAISSCLRGPSLGVPRLSLHSHPPGLCQSNPVSPEAQPLPCSRGAKNLASASPAVLLWS